MFEINQDLFLFSFFFLFAKSLQQFFQKAFVISFRNFNIKQFPNELYFSNKGDFDKSNIFQNTLSLILFNRIIFRIHVTLKDLAKMYVC